MYLICFLSVLHQPDRAIISKWVALRRPRRDNETIVNETENVGFLRVRIHNYPLLVLAVLAQPIHLNKYEIIVPFF